MKNFFLIVCILALQYSATNSQNIEWDAQAYARGNKSQYEAALYFIQENNLTTTNKTVLDIGCGTGEITGYLAQDSRWVHGIDASKNMVDYAHDTQIPLHTNISFEHRYVEEFYTEQKFDLITAFSCFHWFSDKEKALANMYGSLVEGGELFGKFLASDITPPIGFPLIKQMLTERDPSTSVTQSLARSTLTSQELKDMLINNGFELMLFEEQSCDVILVNRSEVEDFIRPVMMSRPFVQNMSPEEQIAFFNEYVDRLTAIMPKTADNQFIQTMTAIIVHARKK